MSGQLALYVANLQRECDALLAENQRLEHERNFLQRELGFKNTMKAENQRLREALERVKRNAEGWHGTNPREVNSVYGQQDALDVIAGWCREALAGDAE